MKKILFFILSLVCTYNYAQDFGVFKAAISIEQSGVNSWYNLEGDIGSESFQGKDLGTFYVNDGSLKITGAEMYSWKNAGNVCGGIMFYRVFPDGSEADLTTYPFQSINLNWIENLATNNDQRWGESGLSINITDFAGGNYTIESYLQVKGDNSGNSGCNDSQYANNSGPNYKANFAISHVKILPELPSKDETVQVFLYSKHTALENESSIYFHSGVSSNPDDTTQFDIAKGNWGQDDNVGIMTQDISNNTIHTITLSSITNYYALTSNDDAFGLNFLFRSPDGAIKEDNNGSNYNVALNNGSFISLTNPVNTTKLEAVGNSVSVEAASFNNTKATPIVADWTLEEVSPNPSTITTTSSANNFTYNVPVSSTIKKDYKITADFGGGLLKSKTFSIQGYNSPANVTMPTGLKAGINYDNSNTSHAYLVLHTPTTTNYKKGDGTVSGSNTTASKNVVHVIGDFNNWEVQEAYKMNKDGDFWWIELTGLTENHQYVFQYFIDGDIRIADPYSEQISDSEDSQISTAVYPDLPTFPSDKFVGVSSFETRASVLQTGRVSYQWEVTDFVAPSRNELNIYELHFRDFTEEGTYLAAIDRLNYLKNLGVNAIHVLPVSEFEGNSSWGYNPNYYFAADKAYGNREHLKKFIDEAHKRGIAVFNDVVLNHAFGSNAMVLMYWDDVNNRPSADNPWFNAEHKAVYSTDGHWGNDWNHESEHTQAFVDRALQFWLDEFNFDGFRFDFTKGITQTAQNPSDEWASNVDLDRQGLLKRMVDEMWSFKSSSIAIFEHLANPAEDKVLADYGILMWSGVGHHNQIKNFNLGYNTDDIDVYTTGVFNSSQWNFNYANLISYAESHDEQRQAYELFTYGNGIKDIADPTQKLAEGIERLKGGTVFNLMLPGSRMLWQFQELGYDVDIDFNGRTGEKPVHWEYYDDANRKELYTLVSQLLQSRLDHNWYSEPIDYTNLGNGTDYSIKRLSLSDTSGNHLIIISNPFANTGSVDATPSYDVVGQWYQNNGDTNFINTPLTVNSQSQTYTLQPGQTMVLTNFVLPVPNFVDTDGDGVYDEVDNCPSVAGLYALDGCNNMQWTGATSTDWNTASNWDKNIVPRNSVDVLVPEGVPNYPISANAVTVNSMSIESGASFVAQSTFVGNVTYTRNLATDNWWLISSPVAGESVVDFLTTNSVATGSGISPAKHVALANFDNTKSASNNIWQYYVDGDFDGLNSDDTTDMMSSGKGYSVKPATVGSTFSFTGTLNTANVTTSIMDGKTVHVDGSPFNLIGNPFTSFVNNSAFLNLAANDNLLESKTIWVWDQSTETYTAKVLLSNFEIAPAQGFFVKRKALGTAASLTFDATNQSHQSDTFQRSFTSEIQLNITDGTKINYAKFYYVNESTTGFDNGYDGELFGGAANSFAIYSHLLSDNVGKKYQIQALPNANLETMIVPIGLHAENGKTITFSAESLNLPSHLKIFLEDREKGSFTRLDEVGNTYTTTLTASLNGTGRFYLYTTESALNTNDNAILSTIGMFQSDATTLKITGLQEEKASLKIFTTLGKEVINTTFEANGVKEFSLPNLAKGVYLVQLKTEKGMVNKKIIFE
ncbi:alpha-amylase family glycosyl hydrolase [Polaribacter sp.]|uniref:alpha-amylase family glycosyl hydrolase n=1 Tax=Polaribacter sp. TaxID=1920175 RepID=UPI003EF49CD7